MEIIEFDGELIKTPGLYRMKEDIYHADPCETPSLSASLGKILCGPERTPAHAWLEHPRLGKNTVHEDDVKDEKRFSIGTVGHSLMLKDPRDIVILNADDWRSSTTRAKREEAEMDGKIALLRKEYDRADRMVKAGRNQLLSGEDTKETFLPGAGHSEIVMIWENGGTWFRSRLDWLPDKRDGFWDDYKTTGSASPEKWEFAIKETRPDFSAAFYRRGIKALGLARRPEMRCIVQETKAPFCLSALHWGEGYMELADRDVDRAIRIWRWCLENNRWPGFPSRTITLQPPKWLEARKMESEIARSEIGGPDDPDLIKIGFEMQAPL